MKVTWKKNEKDENDMKKRKLYGAKVTYIGYKKYSLFDPCTLIWLIFYNISVYLNILAFKI